MFQKFLTLWFLQRTIAHSTRIAKKKAANTHAAAAISQYPLLAREETVRAHAICAGKVYYRTAAIIDSVNRLLFLAHDDVREVASWDFMGDSRLYGPLWRETFCRLVFLRFVFTAATERESLHSFAF